MFELTTSLRYYLSKMQKVPWAVISKVLPILLLSLNALKRKFMSCSHCQELGQLADLASDKLFTLVQPIMSQLAC